MQGEIVKFRLQAQRVQVEAAEFHARSGAQLQLPNQFVADPLFRETHFKYQKHNQKDRGRDADQDREKTQPFALHEPPAFETISNRNRGRLSFNHFSSRSLMAR